MKRPPKWRAFEQLVAQINRQMAPKAEVRESERIKGRSGEVRRLDVTVRQPVGPYQVLIVFDCKRHTRKVPLGYVAAFAQQAHDVRANVAVLVSNTGFTKGARSVALMNSMVLQTLREAEGTDWSRVLGEDAWSALVATRITDLVAHAVASDGIRLTLESDERILDEHGAEFDRIPPLFQRAWHDLGPDRRIGRFEIEVETAPGQVYVRRSERLREVSRVQMSAVVHATRWMIPLSLDHGHVLLDANGKPVYHQLASAGVDWRTLMNGPGTPLSEQEFVDMITKSGFAVDVTNAKRFLRLVVRSKPKNGAMSGRTTSELDDR